MAGRLMTKLETAALAVRLAARQLAAECEGLAEAIAADEEHVNYPTAANMAEFLGLLAEAEGIPVGRPGGQQYRCESERNGEVVTITIRKAREGET